MPLSVKIYFQRASLSPSLCKAQLKSKLKSTILITVSRLHGLGNHDVKQAGTNETIESISHGHI